MKCKVISQLSEELLVSVGLCSMELMYQNTVYTAFDEDTRRREGWGRGGGRRKCIHVGSQTSLSSYLHSEKKRYVTKCRPTHYVLTQGKIIQ